MSINVSALDAFNNELAGRMLMDTVYTGNTAEYVEIQEGIKYSEPLNLASVTPYFQGGDAVSNASGSLDFTQRNIVVSKRTAYDAWNLQLLTSKYLGKAVLDAGSYEDTMTILSGLSEDLVKKAQQGNDDFIWNAVATQVFPGSTVTAAGDGLKALLTAAGGINVPAGQTAITASTAYAQIVELIEAVDVNVKDAGDLTVFVGTSVFQRVVSGFTTQNLFHFDPTSVATRGGMYEVPMPGFPNIKIVGTYGLRSSERVVVGPASDAFIGTDLVSDTSNFQMWYDINSDSLKYRLRNKLGTQIGHPTYWAGNDLA